MSKGEIPGPNATYLLAYLPGRAHVPLYGGIRSGMSPGTEESMLVLWRYCTWHLVLWQKKDRIACQYRNQITAGIGNSQEVTGLIECIWGLTSLQKCRTKGEIMWQVARAMWPHTAGWMGFLALTETETWHGPLSPPSVPFVPAASLSVGTTTLD